MKPRAFPSPFEKRCARCDEVKPRTAEFFRPKRGPKRGPYDVMSYCRPCETVRRREYWHRSSVPREGIQRCRDRRRAYWNARARQHNALRRAWRRRSLGQYTETDMWLVYLEQEGRCKYCGEVLGERFEIDHMTPLCRGGSNGPENICCACMACNRAKHTRTADEFSAFT